MSYIPILLISSNTTQKTISYIQKAASNSANLIVFPESSIPGFPIWSAILPPTQTHNFFHHLAQESLYIDGDEISAIREAARQTQTIVSIGISEKVKYSTATLFNSNLLIGRDGQILIHHRKLMPTFFEKLSWSPGDGYGLRVAETQHGKIGALICGENTNPLARYALMAQGEQVHISTWPAIWPTRVPSSDKPQQQQLAQVTSGRNYDNITANRTRAAAHCFEGKCFGIMSAAYLSADNIQDIITMLPSKDVGNMEHILSNSPRAASMFLDPTGAPIPGFVFTTNNNDNNYNGSTSEADGQSVNTKPEKNKVVKEIKQSVQHTEDILYADLDLNECVEGKQYHDVVGTGYQRFDVFKLQVNRTRRWEPVDFIDRMDFGNEDENEKDES